MLSHSYGECFSCRLLGALALPLVLIYLIEELLSDYINLSNFSVLQTSPWSGKPQYLQSEWISREFNQTDSNKVITLNSTNPYGRMGAREHFLKYYIFPQQSCSKGIFSESLKGISSQGHGLQSPKASVKRQFRPFTPRKIMSSSNHVDFQLTCGSSSLLTNITGKFSL